jgi:hypothetical protein
MASTCYNVYMHKKRLYIVIGLCVAFVGVVLLLAAYATTQQSQQQQSGVTYTKYTGNLACLPHKNTSPDQPQTLECAIGLKTTDGQHYALKDIPDEYKYTEFDTQIVVEGERSDSPTDSKYDTLGTIKVRSIEVVPVN